MTCPRRRGHRYYSESEILKIVDRLKDMGYEWEDVENRTLTELDHIANYEVYPIGD